MWQQTLAMFAGFLVLASHTAVVGQPPGDEGHSRYAP